MNTTEPKRPAKNALLDELFQKFAVFREAKPLALGIHTAIVAQLPEASATQLRTALRIHTASTRYLKGLSQGGARFDLEGNPAGEVTAEQQELAANGLKERFRRGAELKREQEKEKKAREDEAKRAEKLQALAAKFGRG